MWSAKSLTCAFLFTCLFLQDAVVAEEACGIYSCVNGVCISTFSDELRCECVDYWSGENCTDFLPYVIGPDAYLSFHILVLVLNILLLAVSTTLIVLGWKDQKHIPKVQKLGIVLVLIGSVGRIIWTSAALTYMTNIYTLQFFDELTDPVIISILLIHILLWTQLCRSFKSPALQDVLVADNRKVYIIAAAICISAFLMQAVTSFMRVAQVEPGLAEHVHIVYEAVVAFVIIVAFWTARLVLSKRFAEMQKTSTNIGKKQKFKQVTLFTGGLSVGLVIMFFLLVFQESFDPEQKIKHWLPFKTIERIIEFCILALYLGGMSTSISRIYRSSVINDSSSPEPKTDDKPKVQPNNNETQISRTSTASQIEAL